MTVTEPRPEPQDYEGIFAEYTQLRAEAFAELAQPS